MVEYLGILVWPSPHATVFMDIVVEALEKNFKILVKEGCEISLDATIKHKKNSACLTVVGEGSGTSRPLIIGNDHSIFQLGGRFASLHLENLQLSHRCEKDSHKEIGACIFAMNLATVSVKGCDIVSERGFGVWSVQRSSIALTDCAIRSVARSACVSFGHSRLTMHRCLIHSSKIHNVCSRGNTLVELFSCDLVGAQVRSIYAYHSVSLRMENCRVSGTQSPDAAAVDVFSSAPAHRSFPCHPTTDKRVTAKRDLRCDGSTSASSKRNAKEHEQEQQERKQHKYVDGQGQTHFVHTSLHFTMSRCSVHDNAGMGVRVRSVIGSSVSSDVRDCSFSNNARGDLVTECVDAAHVPGDGGNEDDSRQNDADGQDLSKPQIKSNPSPSSSSFSSSSSSTTTTTTASVSFDAKDSQGLRAWMWVWEFERDEVERRDDDGDTGGDSWMPFDPSVSDFLECRHARFTSNYAHATIQSSECDNLCSSQSLQQRDDGDDEDSIQVIESEHGDDPQEEQASGCSVEGEGGGMGGGRGGDVVDPAARHHSPCALHFVTLPPPWDKYEVNFETMEQTNLLTHFPRAVRRVKKCDDLPG